jgi:hypothetical protein
MLANVFFGALGDKKPLAVSFIIVAAYFTR